MRKRILIIDDVPDWQAQLQAILKQDYDVTTVGSYDAAMRIIQNRDVELAIVDLRLNPTDEKNMEGMELLKELAQQRINAIVLTGYPEHQLQQEAERTYKVFDFIDKSTLASNYQRIKDVVREAFSLLESKEKAKAQAIRAASALQSVAFTPDLASWPLRRARKDKQQ